MSPEIDTRESIAVDPRVALHRACDILSGRDEDYAAERNDVGWNGTDSRFGHILADTEPTTWTPRMTEIAVKMLQKYRRQLGEAGFDVESIPTMDAHAKEIERRQTVIAIAAAQDRARYWRVDYDADRREFVVVTPYSPDLIPEIRALPGRMWNPTGDKTNRVPATTYAHAVAVLNFAAAHNLIVSEPAEAAAEALIADTAKEVAKVNEVVAASQAEDADIEIAGLGGTLKAFQRAGIKYALDHDSRVVIADEPGLGKTIEALALIQNALADSPLTRAVVVCPATLKLNWAKEAIKWLPEIVTVEGDSLLLGRWGRKRVRGLTILNGAREVEMRLPDGSMAIITCNDLRARLLIINYDILEKHTAMLEALKAQGVVRIVVFDESHYAKNVKAQRTKLSLQLATGVPAKVCLTGTPVMNRPKELISQLNIIGRLDDFGGFHSFVRKYCSVEYVGAHAADPAGLLDLNRALRATCFVRRRKADVLKELDPKVRTPMVVEISNRAEYEKCEKDLVAHLRHKAENDARFTASLNAQIEEAHRLHEPLKPPRTHCGDCEAIRSEAVQTHIAEAESAGMGPAATLVLIENLKQITARGKLHNVIEWVEDFLDTGEKLVLFVTHKDIAHTIASRFHAPLIIGDTPLGERNRIVEAFQSDPDVRMVVGNITAMGVGLTLTASSNVAFVELGWNPAAHDQAEDRVHRIGQEDSVTAWYFLGQNTIDERIARLIEQKRRVVNATTDGILAAKGASESIMGDLVKELLDA